MDRSIYLNQLRGIDFGQSIYNHDGVELSTQAHSEIEKLNKIQYDLISVILCPSFENVTARDVPH